MEPEELKKRLGDLEAKVKVLEDSKSGMLSGNDLIELVVQNRKEADDYIRDFRLREWDALKERGVEKKIYISNFHRFNVTPFSYDLSLGDQFFSVQKGTGSVERREPDKPYIIDPNETVVVITNEYIAIPKYYSATVWPRFGMVKQGIFQSMVKIDPTWHGKLAIAITNLSPACIELYPGKSFATLLLYTLTSESDYDLWEPSDKNLQDVNASQPLPDEYDHQQQDAIDQFIRENALSRWLKRNGNQVRVFGLKREELERLKKFEASAIWNSFCDALAETWAKAKHEKTNRHVVWMDALGLDNLSKIVSRSDDGRITEKDIAGKTCTDCELVEVAKTYGKPFDVVAKIPLTIMSATVEHINRASNELAAKIEGQRKEVGAQVEAVIMPRMIALMFSVLASLSLTTALLTAILRLIGDGQKPPGDVWFYLFLFGSLLLGLLVILVYGLWRKRKATD